MTRFMAAIAVAAFAFAVSLTPDTGVASPAPRDNSSMIVRQVDGSKPKNVILIIGDGTSSSELTIGRYYLNGAKGPPLAYETLPFAGEVHTWDYHYGSGPPYQPNYVPDSAATATALSTGRKTTEGRVSQGPSKAPDVPGSNAGYETTFEIMRKRGKAIGNVTTETVTNATSAAASSHISQRACQGPEDTRATCPEETKASGGLGSIAEQQVDLKLDVNLGGGRVQFEQGLDDGSGTVIDYAVEQGYRYVTNAAEFAAVQNVRGKPLLGLFNGFVMTSQFAPLVAAPTPGSGSAETRCDEDHRPPEEPALGAMTRKAIQLLEKDRDGFFLQVESAGVDTGGHLSDVCGQIGETKQFDDAVRQALAFQRDHKNTLVVVTGDHSLSAQIVGAASDPPGFYATVQTADGAPMRVSFGTDKNPFNQGHTGARVPIAAIGPQATNVMGIRDQTDLFHTLVGRKARAG